MNDADIARLDDLRTRTLAALKSAIGETPGVALLDAPNQRNVGDAMIWAGEIEYLATLGLRILYSADIHSLSPADLRRKMPDGVILIHGGGNFGDLWKGHQQAREDIVREFRDYKIVQLPQTLYFEDPTVAAQFNSLIADHPNFLALLRDKPSMTRASSDVPDMAASFCHDMALGWTPKKRSRPRARRSDVLVIGRADKESSSGLSSITSDWLPGRSSLQTDWHNSGWRWARWRAHRAVAARLQGLTSRCRARGAAPPRGTNAMLTRTLTRINRLNIDGGIDLISCGRMAVVDRLHAHVLCALLGMEHVVLDNNYGKVRAIYDEYTGAFSTAHFAQDRDAARDLVEVLLHEIDS